MNIKTNDKLGFSIIGMLSMAISALGICSNAILVEYGGYAYAFAGMVFLSALTCFVYAATSKENQLRTRDMLIYSGIATLLVGLLFFMRDICLMGRNWAQFSDMYYMGVALIIIISAIAVFELVRIVLEMLNIKLDAYESFFRFEFLKKKQEEESAKDRRLLDLTDKTVVVEEAPAVKEEAVEAQAQPKKAAAPKRESMLEVKPLNKEAIDKPKPLNVKRAESIKAGSDGLFRTEDFVADFSYSIDPSAVEEEQKPALTEKELEETVRKAKQ